MGDGLWTKLSFITKIISTLKKARTTKIACFLLTLSNFRGMADVGASQARVTGTAVSSSETASRKPHSSADSIQVELDYIENCPEPHLRLMTEPGPPCYPQQTAFGVVSPSFEE